MQFAKPRGILLDIEGTTSSITFVHDVMFPFVLQHLDEFLTQHWKRDDVAAVCATIAGDAGHESLAAWRATQPGASEFELVTREVRRLMADDAKATGLKALQGLIWHEGFESGDLVAHSYPDVIPAIRRWREAGIDVRIYSSGSIAAQKLFFGHLENHGNCLELLTGHYDTTSGGKKESPSYINVTSAWGIAPSEVIFISDIAGELSAALEAGIQAVASVRPGNTPLPNELNVPRIESFDELQF